MRGYCGIGIYNSKDPKNIGTLWRSAYIMGASFIFCIGKRYKHQASDTVKSTRHIPFYEYETFDEFNSNRPKSCQLIAIELDENSTPIKEFKHPLQGVYLLGAEDGGLPKCILEKCQHIIQLPGEHCLNVSVAGSIVLFDRINKGK